MKRILIIINTVVLISTQSILGQSNKKGGVAFAEALTKVSTSNVPDDQKLLLVRKLMPYATTVNQKKQIIEAAGKIKTFLALVFVSEFLEDQSLSAIASNAAIVCFLNVLAISNGVRSKYPPLSTISVPLSSLK